MRINVQPLAIETTVIWIVLIVLLSGGVFSVLNSSFLLPISGNRSVVKSNFQPSNLQYQPPNRGAPKATQATGSRG